ncbi:MAG: HNH endonuclease, partial [Oscillospiraceae bacterium]|nr:HNH endonuclease [Oscillospiraceae bacterium]
NGRPFCSRQCHMKLLNAELNPGRMTPQVREKLREARIGSGESVSYEKTYGRHTHRIVAEQILGRALLPGEVVHHIDGNKRNNDPANLMVFASQSEHAAWHMAHRSGEVMPK